MSLSLDNSVVNFLLGVILAYIVIVILVIAVFAVAAYFVLRRFQHYISPDLAAMSAKLDILRKRNPQATTEDLVGKIIREQSLKCGIIGAITGLGGFFTLPIGLPIDLLVSMRLQTTMVQFIALLYGQGQPNNEELRLQTYLVMTGGLKVTETTFEVIMKFALRVLGDSLAKIIPVVGFLVGFGVNYFIAQATGSLAMRWYANKGLTH